MKKILIITSHPSSRGFTHKIAETYKTSAEKNGHKVEIIDLYNSNWREDYLSFENSKEIPKNDIRTKIQNLILESNHLVFIHPIWWLGTPAIMKNFVDSNFSAGFAFKYLKNNPRPIGLLAGRTADVFITCDARGILAFGIKKFLWVWWKISVFGTCGIKLKKITLFSKMFLRNEKEKNGFLAKTEKIASSL